jgi:hydrogenase-4 component E
MALNLFALGSGRLTTLIGAVSAQGMALGAMPLLMDTHIPTGACGSSRSPPWSARARDSHSAAAGDARGHIEREIDPLIGFVPSLLLGAGGPSRRSPWRACSRSCPNTPGRCWCRVRSRRC